MDQFGYCLGADNSGCLWAFLPSCYILLAFQTQYNLLPAVDWSVYIDLSSVCPSVYIELNCSVVVGQAF